LSGEISSLKETEMDLDFCGIQNTESSIYVGIIESFWRLHHQCKPSQSERSQKQTITTKASYESPINTIKMVASDTVITLKGSVEIVSEFFFTAINSILYQRGESSAANGASSDSALQLLLLFIVSNGTDFKILLLCHHYYSQESTSPKPSNANPSTVSLF